MFFIRESVFQRSRKDNYQLAQGQGNMVGGEEQTEVTQFFNFFSLPLSFRELSY